MASDPPHDRLAANLEMLEGLLRALTGVLDIRGVFDAVAEIAGKVLPHDGMSLPVLTDDGAQVRTFATAGLPPGAWPELQPVNDVMRWLIDEPWDWHILTDLDSTPDPRDMSQRLVGGFSDNYGYRSLLRVPIRLDGRLVGLLGFFARSRSAFGPEDALVARRIADHVALALSHQRLAEALARATRLETRVRDLTAELDARIGYGHMIGESAPWRRALTEATQVAPTETTVLLLGESGTGKEVVARFLHRASPRRDGPFVALNCAALPEHLLEAELFGYERGAFTGAVKGKPGQIEQAAGGVLFLDEIGEMTPSAQAKFLRVLQEREFQRLGGTHVLRADIRVIAATNRDLKQAMERGAFREDLYYRIHVFAIRLPALRDRRDDILALTEAFLAEIGRNLGRPPSGIAREAREALLAHAWPGNVRELRNALERAAILADGGLIVAEHLALAPPAPAAAPVARAMDTAAATPRDIPSAERAMIEKALHEARFNKSRAARALGLTRAQLYVRMKRHGLE